jgi:hypothetical protein
MAEIRLLKPVLGLALLGRKGTLTFAIGKS